MAKPDLKQLYQEAVAEIQRLTDLLAQAQKQLSEAITGNKELQQQLKGLQEKLDRVIHQLEKKNKKEHGSKTEKHNPRPAQADSSQPPSDRFKRPRRKPPANRPITEQGLTVEPVQHDVAAGLLCPNCHIDTKPLSCQITRQLERMVGSIKLLEHIQEVRSCQKCKQYVVTAEKPMAPIPGSYVGPGLLAYVIVSKFADGLPLYRIRKILAREGATLPGSTFSDWILASSFTLAPLYELMKRELLRSKIIKTDDSPLKVLDRKLSRKTRKGKLTVYVAHPYTIFDFSSNQSFDRNKAFLKNFKGFVQADAAPGFDALFADGSKTEIGCNAHSRRGHFDCLSLHQDPVLAILDIFSALYDIEAEIASLPDAKKLAWRKQKSKPLVKQLHQLLTRIRPTLTPKDPLRRAIDYTLKHWIALTRFLGDPDFDLDNTASERAIKDFVISRKAFLFAGSDKAGKAAAIHLSLVISAKQNNIDPLAYLTDVLARINSLKTSELQKLLPDRWAEARKLHSGATPPAGLPP